MEATESLLISISGHFQEFHSGFDFELPISFESGKREKKLGSYLKNIEMGLPPPFFQMSHN